MTTQYEANQKKKEEQNETKQTPIRKINHGGTLTLKGVIKNKEK